MFRCTQKLIIKIVMHPARSILWDLIILAMELAKNFDVQGFKNEIQTQNDMYTVYAEGLYRAIKTTSQELCIPLKIPLYVMENGIATDNAKKRTLFFTTLTFCPITSDKRWISGERLLLF